MTPCAVGYWETKFLMDEVHIHCDSRMPCLCYTFHANISLNTISPWNGLKVNLQADKNFSQLKGPKPRWTFYFHPKGTQFANIRNLMNANPVTIEPGWNWDIRLGMKKANFLNKKSSYCTAKRNYTYNACMEKCMFRIVAKESPCVLPFVGVSSAPICNSTNKYKLFKNQYFKRMNNFTSLLDECSPGCPLQCNHTFITAEAVKTTPTTKPYDAKLLIYFPTGQLEVISEYWVYELISFVADFGGFLGMFLGASMISLYDGIHNAIINRAAVTKTQAGR